MLFAYLLQGVAQASAHLSVDSQFAQHGAGHGMTADDHACCPGDLRSADDCAELCALAAAPPMAFPDLAVDRPFEYQSATADAPLTPIYAPLKPPPKSWL
jgi:hypothetical protein